MRELAVIHCLRFPQAVLCLFPKNVGSPMRSFKGNIIIYIEYSQPSILSTLLYIFLNFFIQFYQCTFFQRISERQSPWNKFLIEAVAFSEQHRLCWNESSHLKQLLFGRNIFFRLPSCLEQLLFPNNYSLVTNTFSDQLLLEDKCFFSTATVSEELFL